MELGGYRGNSPQRQALPEIWADPPGQRKRKLEKLFRERRDFYPVCATTQQHVLVSIYWRGRSSGCLPLASCCRLPRMDHLSTPEMTE